MFKRKRNKENVPEFAVVLQKEIDEIMNIVEEQHREMEQLENQMNLLQELCNQRTEQ